MTNRTRIILALVAGAILSLIAAIDVYRTEDYRQKNWTPKPLTMEQASALTLDGKLPGDPASPGDTATVVGFWVFLVAGATALGLTYAVPWCWYFSLARIKETSNAIQGK